MKKIIIVAVSVFAFSCSVRHVSTSKLNETKDSTSMHDQKSITRIDDKFVNDESSKINDINDSGFFSKDAIDLQFDSGFSVNGFHPLGRITITRDSSGTISVDPGGRALRSIKYTSDKFNGQKKESNIASIKTESENKTIDSTKHDSSSVYVKDVKDWNVKQTDTKKSLFSNPFLYLLFIVLVAGCYFVYRKYKNLNP